MRSALSPTARGRGSTDVFQNSNIVFIHFVFSGKYVHAVDNADRIALMARSFFIQGIIICVNVDSMAAIVPARDRISHGCKRKYKYLPGGMRMRYIV